jgi:ubiquinone/menaquinone biosynthesis C-methylase UbiE
MTPPAYAMNPSSFAEMYEGWLVQPLFRPWAEMLLERVPLAAGNRVLDVACGTGIVARLAKQRLGDASSVTGVDLSAQMLEVARAVSPGVDWRQGNALALPFAASEAFDVVFCQQGLQFFPDKLAAAREMRRVLAPGGRLGVATWRPVEEIPFFLALQRVAERHLGTIVDSRYAFGDATAVAKVLTDAGFRDARVTTESLTIHFPDAAPFLRMNATALVGMGVPPGTITDEERTALVAAIAGESADVVPAFAEGAGVAFAISTNLGTARA